MKDSDKLFSPDFVLISCIGMVVRLGMFIKITMQPLYLIELYSSKTYAGLAMTIFTVSAIILRPASGRIIDKYGRKPVFILGTSLVGLTTLPFGLLENLAVLYALQFIGGLGFSIQSVASTTMVTDIVPEKNLTQGLGYYGVTATLAQATGPAAALFLISAMGYRLGFILAGAVQLSVLIIIIFVRYERGRIPSEKKSSCESNNDKRSLLDSLIERSAAYPALFMGILTFNGAAVTTFLIPYAQFVGISGIGIFFTARAAGVVFARVFAGKLADIIGNFRIMLLALFITTLGILGINIMRNIPVVILSAVLYGVGYGLASLMLNVKAVLNTSPDRRAAANATYFLAMDGGVGIGAASWGVVGDLIGLGGVFSGSAAVSILTLSAFGLIRKSRTVFK